MPLSPSTESGERLMDAQEAFEAPSLRTCRQT